MTHLLEARIIQLTAGDAQPTAAETEHLADCAACRTLLQGWQQVADDLALYNRATPGADQLATYYAMANQVQRAPSSISRVWQAVQLALAWDSRQQLAASGVRSVHMPSYRLLFTHDMAEIELMVVNDGHTRRIVGELAASPPHGVALVELTQPDGGEASVTTAADDGRFQLDDVPPGAYRLSLTPVSGNSYVVESLEIS